MVITIQDIREMVSRTIGNLINEDVYIHNPTKSDIMNKQLQLNYNDSSSRNKDILTQGDKLRTNKMDQSGHDTYIVPLKGGIDSYNITSINGTEVMHYFKRLWMHQKTTVKLANGGLVGKKNNDAEEYELTMLRSELDRFMLRFRSKVGAVINYCMDKFGIDRNDKSILGIYIYPVPSSSNFNDKMADELVKIGSVLSLPVKKINQNLLVKDMRGLTIDKDFTDRNSDYFNGKLYQRIPDPNRSDVSVYDSLNNKLNSPGNEEKFRVSQYVSDMNTLVDMMDDIYRSPASASSKNLDRMAQCYSKYCQLYNEIGDSIVPVKYTKYPTRKNKTEIIHNIAKNIGKYPIPETPVQVTSVSPAKYRGRGGAESSTGFEIKKWSNGERMGIKNIYNPNSINTKLVDKYRKKAPQTVVVVFDDNISGGATLSDVCYQLKNLGFKYIVPITFGAMDVKWQEGMGKVIYTKPEGGFNY